MPNWKLKHNLAIAFARWVALAVMLRILFISPNHLSNSLLRNLAFIATAYNLYTTFPGKTLRYRLTNALTGLFDLIILGVFTYYSPIHQHYWTIFYLLPVFYAAYDYGVEAAFITAVAAGLSHGAAIIINKYALGLVRDTGQLTPEMGPIVGLFLIYVFFGLVVSQLKSSTEAEKDAGDKMRQVTNQLGAAVRFLGVAGDKAQRSAEQLAAAIKLIGTTAYSGVSLQSGMDSIFDQLIKGTVEILQAGRGTLMLADSRRQKLILKSGWGEKTTLLPQEIEIGDEEANWTPANIHRLIIAESNNIDRQSVAELSDYLVVPITVEERIVGTLALADKRNGFFAKDDYKVAATVAGEAAMVIINDRLYRDTLEKKAALERLIKEVQSAQESERRRVARDLHDGTAQDLAKLALDLGLLKLQLKRVPKKTIAAVEKLENNIDTTIKELRGLIYNLRPASLDKFGLAATLEQYLKKFSAGSGIKVKLKYGLSRRLPEEYEINLFRLIQESLNNVRKYAGVKQAEVEVSQNSDHIELRVKDKGKGFNPEKIDLLGGGSDNFGLLGMKERAEALSGRLIISAAVGKGTTIKAVLPAVEKSEGKVKSAAG